MYKCAPKVYIYDLNSVILTSIALKYSYFLLQYQFCCAHITITMRLFKIALSYLLGRKRQGNIVT